MANTSTRSHLHRLAWFTAATLVGGGCDLQTKAWAERALSGLPSKSMSVFQPWLDLTLAYNRGTAFSVVTDLGAARWIFGIVALLVVAALVALLVGSRRDRIDALAMGAIAGGALGNGLDRVFRDAPGGGTGVVDFLQVNYPWGGHWPLFNVADALLAVGVLVLVGRGLLVRRGVTPVPSPH
jgi:signal peptidase II